MKLVFTIDDGTGDAIVLWYDDWSQLSAEKVANGTPVDDALLVAPEVEPWQDARPYLLPGPDVEWRTVDKAADDPSHVFRELSTLKPSALGVDPWVMPTGSHDAPGIGDHRLHNDIVWKSTIDGNTVEPGTHPGFDWWVESEPPAVPDKLRQPLAALRPQVEAASDVTTLRAAVLAILDTMTGA